jgi:hypothetical protein
LQIFIYNLSLIISVLRFALIAQFWDSDFRHYFHNCGLGAAFSRSVQLSLNRDTRPSRPEQVSTMQCCHVLPSIQRKRVVLQNYDIGVPSINIKYVNILYILLLCSRCPSVRCASAANEICNRSNVNIFEVNFLT